MQNILLWNDSRGYIGDGMAIRKKPQESVCVTETQMENIIDAAREEKGACPKAKDFVNAFKPKRAGLESVDFVEKQITKKIGNFLDELQRYF